MDILFESGSCAQVVELTSPAEIEALRDLFETVAQEQGWQPGGQIQAFQERSHYLAVQVDGEIVGGMQMVLPDRSGCLPCQQVWPEIPLDITAHAVHGTILALLPEYRGHSGLFWPLCVEAWRYCVSHSIDTVIMEATPTMLERYRRVGWPLEEIGELRLHWGEDCYLCQMHTADIAGLLLTRAFRTPLYRSLVVQAMRPKEHSRCTVRLALP